MNFAKQYDTGNIVIALSLTKKLWETIKDQPLELANCTVHACETEHYFKKERWFYISQFGEDSVWRAELDDYLVIGNNSVDSVGPAMFNFAYQLFTDEEQVTMIKLFQNYDMWLGRIAGE